MFQVSYEQFNDLVNEAMSKLPKEHVKNLENVALIIEDVPSEQQRQNLNLAQGRTLLGLYEGTPLSKRQGTLKMLPDKITLFKMPIEYQSNSLEDIKEEIKHTLWHEIAHYYGLDHKAIRDLE